METLREIRLILYIRWLDIKALPSKIKRRIWNKHILLWWFRLWIRKDEFHRSLDMDEEAVREMNKEERENYFADLLRRKKIAHRRH